MDERRPFGLHRIAFLLVAALCLFAMPAADAESLGRLRVRVLNAVTEMPVTGAKITLRDRADTRTLITLVTNVEGRAVSPMLEPRPWRITAEADNYQSRTETAAVHAASMSEITIAMIPVTAASPAAAETRDDEVEKLKRTVQEQNETIKKLLERVERLEKEREAKPGEAEPEIPPVQIPTETPTAQPERAARATLLPDIAVIGTNTGRFLSVRGDPDRNRLQLGEFEIAMQQPVFTDIAFRATLAGGADEGFGIGVEEAYVNFGRVAKLPFGGMLGQKRASFGKLNPVHPHARLFADQPAPLSAFLGEEALFGNGAALNYTFPLKNLFLNLEVGFFKAASHGHGDEEHNEEEHEDEHTEKIAEAEEETHAEPGFGAAREFPLARLWMAKEFGKSLELELGGSFAFGKAENGDRVNLTGLDLTLRNFPGTFQRLLLQSEIFWHRREDRAGGTGTHTRSGHYALLSYRPDRYNEWGLRFDNTRFPWPLDGREQSYSLIYTNRLTEATLLRFQYKFGDRTQDYFLPSRRGFNELYLQFIWGAGSHSHPLQ
jgi:5-hydroxyisourate hydrolase-like protein (transthyretin family)